MSEAIAAKLAILDELEVALRARLLTAVRSEFWDGYESGIDHALDNIRDLRDSLNASAEDADVFRDSSDDPRFLTLQRQFGKNSSSRDIAEWLNEVAPPGYRLAHMTVGMFQNLVSTFWERTDDLVDAER